MLTEDIQCVPSGSVTSAGSLWWREQRGGSCWFTGAVWGFPHPSSLHLRKQILRHGLTTDSRLFTSMVIYWHEPQQITSQEKKIDLMSKRGLGNSKMERNYSKLSEPCAKWWFERRMAWRSLFYFYTLETRLQAAPTHTFTCKHLVKQAVHSTTEGCLQAKTV